VAVVRLVLDVRGRDRDAALLLLRSVVDLANDAAWPPYFSASTVVMAAVSVVLPWSM
jgi:hypothetical protein